MQSVKQGGIKYHFLSLWNDSTWDGTQVSRAIGEHSNHYANGNETLYGIRFWSQHLLLVRSTVSEYRTHSCISRPCLCVGLWFRIMKWWIDGIKFWSQDLLLILLNMSEYRTHSCINRPRIYVDFWFIMELIFEAKCCFNSFLLWLNTIYTCVLVNHVYKSIPHEWVRFNSFMEMIFDWFCFMAHQPF